MNTQNFTWTNELVLEFFFNANRQATAEKAITDFIASKQKSLGYEILLIKSKYSGLSIRYESGKAIWRSDTDEPRTLSRTTEIKEIHLPHYYILEVKRLSDGEVFAVGDNTREGIIKSFEIDNSFKGGLKIIFNDNGVQTFLRTQKETPKKQPILTTHDGVELFEGDDEFDVDLEDFEINHCKCIPITTKDWDAANKAFSTKEAAEHFVIMNKPHLSVQDVVDCYKKNYNPDASSFIQIFSKKTNQTQKINDSTKERN